VALFFDEQAVADPGRAKVARRVGVESTWGYMPMPAVEMDRP
jgi:hypothetical protein